MEIPEKKVPKPPEQLIIQFNPTTGQMSLAGMLLQTQAQKDHAVQMLLQAINIVVNVKLSVIQPATSIPAGNGMTH